jgi:NTE family protein
MSGGLALVMSGGGARAAYQIGVLSSLAKQIPDLHVPIVTGVSAGAINAAWYAATPGTFGEQTARLADLWRSLTPEQIFRVDAMSLGTNVMRWGARLISGGVPTPQVRGLVDTSPLRALLTRVLDAPEGRIEGVKRNLERGALDALAITASSYTTGRSVTWVEGRAIEMWDRPGRRSAAFTPTVEHVMASAALPIVFPAINVDREWYGDGGMRLVAPFAPAIHLGASRILAVSTRWGMPAEAPTELAPYPPPAQVAGAMLESVFLDAFDADALRLEETNALVRRAPEGDRLGLRPIDLLVVRPSSDIGRLVSAHEPELPRGLRFLMRGLGSHQTRHHSLMSLLMFQPAYLASLVELGEKDTDARPEIAAFLRGVTAPATSVAPRDGR